MFLGNVVWNFVLDEYIWVVYFKRIKKLKVILKYLYISYMWKIILYVVIGYLNVINI